VSCNDSASTITSSTRPSWSGGAARFVGIKDKLKCYFAMARGTDTIPAMEMTKWFDTNYHYIVPELQADTAFRLDASKPLLEYKEAKMLGFEPKINLLGPL
jgi:5-methyltetrahydropteroyltriglutamate--homocysteine methyltransferase